MNYIEKAPFTEQEDDKHGCLWKCTGKSFIQPPDAQVSIWKSGKQL